MRKKLVELQCHTKFQFSTEFSLLIFYSMWQNKQKFIFKINILYSFLQFYKSQIIPLYNRTMVRQKKTSRWIYWCVGYLFYSSFAILNSKHKLDSRRFLRTQNQMHFLYNFLQTKRSFTSKIMQMLTILSLKGTNLDSLFIYLNFHNKKILNT